MKIETKIRILIVFALVLMYIITIVCCNLFIPERAHLMIGVFIGMITLKLNQWYTALNINNDNNP